MRAAGVLGERSAARDFEDLDSALEHCENTLLTTTDASSIDHQLFVDWLTDELGSRKAALDLLQATIEEPAAPGAFLCRESDPTDSLIFVEAGRISVVLGVDGPKPLRLRVIKDAPS